jgi:hypothetical protein
MSVGTEDVVLNSVIRKFVVLFEIFLFFLYPEF